MYKLVTGEIVFLYNTLQPPHIHRCQYVMYKQYTYTHFKVAKGFHFCAAQVRSNSGWVISHPYFYSMLYVYA